MEKYAILLEYFEKQIFVIDKLYQEIISVNVKVYDKRFLFAFRMQQFYTALEDLLKQIAKTFENHIASMPDLCKELLVRMNTEIPKIRPAVLSSQSMVFLDKLRAFRHFIRHAYDCELDEKELHLIQDKLIAEFFHVKRDLEHFRGFVETLV